MDVSLDFSQALGFEALLAGVPARLVPKVEVVTRQAAENIKDGLAADAQNDGHYPHFASAITSERKFSSLTSITYEVGPDKDLRQGALGNILYFGTKNNGPVLDFDAPVRREEPSFLRELRAAAEGLL